MPVMKFKGKRVDFSEAKVMGVVNVTPDSFYDGGRIKDDRTLLTQAERMLSEGADFLDVGGYSSRPGAALVSVEEERRRAIPAISSILKRFPETFVSVDTFRAAIASEAIAAGAAFVNDISAGDDDPDMVAAVARLKVPYVAMHKQGTSGTMQKNPRYQNVVEDIFSYLSKKVASLEAAGINDIIIDPGFGFGKTLAHNYALLANLSRFSKIGRPLLVGLSRKSMIQKVVGASASDALFGTVAAQTIALLSGASMLRVHDVRPAKDAIAIVRELKNINKAHAR